MAAGVKSPEEPLSPRQWNKALRVINGQAFTRNFSIVHPENLYRPIESPRMGPGLIDLGQNHYTRPIFSALEAIGIDTRSYTIMILSLGELAVNPREVPDNFKMSTAGVFIRRNLLRGIEDLINNPRGSGEVRLLEDLPQQLSRHFDETKQTETLDAILHTNYLLPIRRALQHSYMGFGETSELAFEILGGKVLDNFARLLGIQGRLLLTGDEAMADKVRELTQVMAFGRHIVGSVGPQQLLALAT